MCVKHYGNPPAVTAFLFLVFSPLCLATLPEPWIEQDIGTVGIAGSASFDTPSSGLVTGSGAGVAAKADGFHYLYQSLNGDGQIVMRVATQENPNGIAQAGLMIRETPDPGSKYAAVLIKSGKGVFFQRRIAPGGSTSQNAKTGKVIAAPYWLKLIRQANKFTAYYSTTETGWTQLGSAVTIAMPGNVLIGVAVSSSNNTLTSTATFTNLNLAPKADAGNDLWITYPNNATLAASGTDDGLPTGALDYTWASISGPGQVIFSSPTTANTDAAFSVPGIYLLSATASDGNLASSDYVVVVVDLVSTTRHRYLYVAIDGGGLEVYDIDNGHALVKSLQPVTTNGEIQGICASASTARLYVSYGSDGMYALDLLNDKVLYNNNYPPGVDRMDIDASNSQIYMPSGEGKGTIDYDNVIDAMTGRVITQVHVAKRTHDTLCSGAGPRAYLEAVTSKYVSVVDTTTNQVSRLIGPFGNSVRPFCFNASETVMYANINSFFGFEIADMTTGRVISRVPISGFSYTPQSTPSHGIGLTPDGKEVWVCDSTNPYIHVFDVSLLPPTQIASIPVSGGTTHWVTFNNDGRFAYPGGPHYTTLPVDVIDTQTRQKVTSIAASRNLLEVDFEAGTVVDVGKQYGVGRE